MLKLWTLPATNVGSWGRGTTSKAVALCSSPPPPPSPPWKWQAAHDRALNTGPSPSPPASGSFAAHSCSNSSRPSATSDARADGPHRMGRPSEKNCQYTTAPTTASAPSPATHR